MMCVNMKSFLLLIAGQPRRRPCALLRFLVFRNWSERTSCTGTLLAPVLVPVRLCGIRAEIGNAAACFFAW